MPDWILLLPIVFPPLGALGLALLSARVSERVRFWLAPVFLILEIALLLFNIAPGTHRLVISNWQAAGFTIALQMDGITQLLALTMFVPLIALWLIAPPRAPFGLWPILVVSAALLLASAATPVTIYVAWTLLDLALFVWRIAHNIQRDQANHGFMLGALAGLIFFGGTSLITTRPAEGALLIGLALWARLGLFPFHGLYPAQGKDRSEVWFARGIPLLAASSVWLHWDTTLNLPVTAPLIGVLAGVVFVITTLWLWREEQPARAIDFSAAYTFAFVPLALAFGGDAATAFGLWLALSAALAIAWFEIALRWRAENRNRWARLIWFAGIFSLASIPLTPAFLGRLGLLVALTEYSQWVMLALIGVTSLFIFAPLWNFGFTLKGTEERAPTRAEYAGLIVLALFTGTLALAPMMIAHALAPAVGDAAERALDRVIRTNDLIGVIIGAIILLAPVIASYILRNMPRGLHPASASWEARLARALELDWLEQVIANVGLQISAAARSSITIAEENPTVWILLMSLWIAIFIIIAR